jgi:hypothetical protein
MEIGVRIENWGRFMITLLSKDRKRDETYLESGSTRTEKTLPSLDESIVVSDNVSDFDDIGVTSIVEDLDRL